MYSIIVNHTIDPFSKVDNDDTRVDDDLAADDDDGISVATEPTIETRSIATPIYMIMYIYMFMLLH